MSDRIYNLCQKTAGRAKLSFACPWGLYFHMPKVIPMSFFARPTLGVSKELLGKFLVRRCGRRTIASMITEVEAYVGHKDRASHASRGKTPRNEVMFGKPGYWYVYFVYGMYFCLNIVTERKGYPAAILIRAVEGVVGPGRVCCHFKIDRSFNKMPAAVSSELWIEDRGVRISSLKIKRGTRIGVEYAGEWKDKKWRFYCSRKFSKEA